MSYWFAADLNITKTVNTSRYDYINIALMLAACAVAFVIPFELFLFSYAVLGPLHYLTEITWLHKRNYFALKGKDWRILYCAGSAILIFNFAGSFLSWSTGMSLDELGVAVPKVMAVVDWMDGQSVGLTFFAFASALVMILVKGHWGRIGAYLIMALIGLGLSHAYGSSTADPRWFYLFFAIFLPTLIHVYLFTGAFMLYGALKQRSRVGVVSVFILLLCGLSFFVIRPDGFFAISDYAKGSYNSSFLGLNIEVLKILVPQEEILLFIESNPHLSFVYDSNWGVVVTRFIAFAYTYHYLNWFSKTKIIRWHEAPRSWLVSVLVLWVISVGLYLYNYRVGLIALYFLSFLHVFLEFPLNWVSFKGIGVEAIRRISRSEAS